MLPMSPRQGDRTSRTAWRSWRLKDAEARAALLAADAAWSIQFATASFASGQGSEVVFLYTGAGAQYPGMGRALYQAAPVFRDAIDHCDSLLGPDAKGRTLKSVFWETTGDPPIHHSRLHSAGHVRDRICADDALAIVGVVPAAVDRTFRWRICGSLRCRRVFS